MVINLKKKIYVLNQRQEETFDAAGKAMRDVFSVLKSRDAKVIWSVPKGCAKVLKVLDLPYLALFLLFRAGKRDLVFYSIPENRMKIRLLKMMQKIRGYGILCFINDLNAFRYEVGSVAELNEESKQELEAVAAADYVLAPNENTKAMLTKLGVKGELVPVGIWDYRMSAEQAGCLRAKSCGFTNEAPAGEHAREVHIAFAGNLNKSNFLSVMELPERVTMELWGKLDEEKQKALPAGCHYHGLLSSDEIPLAICNMDYGLVWDGSGKDDIEGGLGEYLRYNNSHKCALYLASGIPVIVWAKSGMAHFVKEHACGITIERLGELEEKLMSADYATLKKNAMEAAPKLWQGYYLGRALDEVLQRDI